MAYPNKTQLPISVSNRTKLDLSCQHVTTADFMQFNVSKILELVPNQTIDVRHECFARLAPMPLPTFGRATIKHRSFFVPFRTLWPAWTDFYEDTPHTFDGGTLAIPSNVPTVSNSSLYNAFIYGADFVEPVSSSVVPDFVYASYDMSGSVPADGVYPNTGLQGYKFTAKGRQAFKILRSLGYNITFTNANSDVFSALPLLALARVYLDFYYPSQYINDDDSAFIQSLLVDNAYRTSWSSVFSYSNISRLLSMFLRVTYQDDYFVSAWDNPTTPNSGLLSSITINSIDDDTKVVGGNDDSPALVGTSSSSVPSITQYALNALRALSDWMRRKQIVGSRAFDRYLAQFGVKLAPEKLNRSVFIDEYVQDLQFGDVMSTSDTDGAQLGSYAGKGISYGDGKYQYSADEFGYFIIVSTIVPHVQYFQGINRSVMHLSKLDFFTSEFDALGTQAIARKELYVPTTPVRYPVGYEQKVFGFAPRYAEYKQPYSQLTGDMALPSMKVSNSAWTLFRDMDLFLDNDNVDGDYIYLDGIEHNRDFVMSGDAAQYNRIFYNTDDTADHINLIHNFEITSSFPGKSLYDDYEFENEDKANKVTVSVSGSTLT